MPHIILTKRWGCPCGYLQDFPPQQSLMDKVFNEDPRYRATHKVKGKIIENQCPSCFSVGSMVLLPANEKNYHKVDTLEEIESKEKEELDEVMVDGDFEVDKKTGEVKRGPKKRERISRMVPLTEQEKKKLREKRMKNLIFLKNLAHNADEIQSIIDV